MTARISRTRASAIAVLAAVAVLTGCAADAPAPDPEPTFDGVVGLDWVEIPTDPALMSGFDVPAGSTVPALRYGMGALWLTLGYDVYSSSDGSTWDQVPLDPRRPADLFGSPIVYADDERIVIAQRDRVNPAPWITIGDGSEWEHIAPDEIGSPSVSGSRPLEFRGIYGISPIGDSLLILMGVQWVPEGGGSVPCNCASPLVLHPDGSSDWVAVQDSLLGPSGSFFSAKRLFPVEDGILLITSAGRDGPGIEVKTYHSADGIDWTDRTQTSIALYSGYGNAPAVRNDIAWLTVGATRDSLDIDADPTLPDRTLVLVSDDAVDWHVVYTSADDEYWGTGQVAATESGFYVLIGSDVISSPDTVEWTVHRDALTVFAPLRLQSVVAVGDGLVALTTDTRSGGEEPPRLWVSGMTAFTPDPEATDEP